MSLLDTLIEGYDTDDTPVSGEVSGHALPAVGDLQRASLLDTLVEGYDEVDISDLAPEIRPSLDPLSQDVQAAAPAPVGHTMSKAVGGPPAEQRPTEGRKRGWRKSRSLADQAVAGHVGDLTAKRRRAAHSRWDGVKAARAQQEASCSQVVPWIGPGEPNAIPFDNASAHLSLSLSCTSS